MASSTNPESNTLTEPLLSPEEQEEEEVTQTSESLVVPDGEEPSQEPAPFTVRNEVFAMFSLGFPLAVSFFCRMGMASTDSAFVGHIDDGKNSPEVYLAAAVLSDMVLNICITPPLAFNQVLNGLVSQAVGSNNPRMAGIWLQQSMFWLATTMLPFLAALFYVEPILRKLAFPEDICIVAGTYAKYNVFWPVPNGLYQCMRFYFQARGLPRPAMYNNIIFLFVNALLNWIFVFGGPIPGWNGLGFIGAAISLSISRTMQGVCYYLYMFVYKKHHIDAWPEEGWSFSHHTKDRTKEFMAQSLPNIGTLLFQAFASQAQTVLVGRLGELPIAASSALSTVTIPWSGTLSATTCMVSAIRVGYHLGKGDPNAAKKSSWLVMHFITAVNVVMAIVFLVPLCRDKILSIATSDTFVIDLVSRPIRPIVQRTRNQWKLLPANKYRFYSFSDPFFNHTHTHAQAKKLVPAMLVSTYLNLLVGNGTSGIFSGQGRPLIATILSFGLELPLSIGGVAIYILVFHGDLVGVYWLGAIMAAIEIVIVLYLVITSDWAKCADEARARQEASSSGDDDDAGDDADLEDGETTSAATTEATTDVASSTSSSEEDPGSEALEATPTAPEEEASDVPPASASAEVVAIDETPGPLATAAAKKKGGKKKRRGKRG
jgi:MATE family multidrug resistance protein